MAIRKKARKNSKTGDKPHEECALEYVARMMLLRHVRNSLPTSRSRALIFDELGWDANHAPRVFFVVGAGASVPITQRSDHLGEHLVGTLEHSSRQEYEAEIRRLQRIWNHPEPDFEMILAALARTPYRAQLLQEAISKEFRVRHPTQLGYEILAHLMKHRFIDGIFNLNFDELLDQSLVDEVGVGEFISVVSPRDVSDIESYDPEVDHYRPIYVKPHGTVSDPPTLRFTRQAYDEVPDELCDVMSKMFGAGPVVLVSLGYSMRDFDFLETLPPGHRLTVVNMSFNPITDDDRTTIFRLCPGVSIREVPRADWEEVPDEGAQGDPAKAESVKMKSAANEAMSALFDALKGLVSRNTYPDSSAVHLRPIHRHLAITRFLASDDDLSDPLARVGYLERRAVLEAAFTLVRGRGLVSISALAKDRVAAYHRLAVEAGSQKSWESILASGGLVVSDLTPQTYLPLDALDVCCHGNDPAPEYRGTRFHEIDSELLARHVMRSVFIDGNPRDEEQYLVETFKELATGTEIEIHSTDDDVCSRVYRDPKICSTTTALRGRTVQMLREQTTMSQLAIAAETGSWLLKDTGSRQAIEAWRARCEARSVPWRMLVMVSFTSDRQGLFEQFGAGEDTSGEVPSSGMIVVHQPWWRHDARMSVALKKDVPLEALSFARRRRSVFVTPVHLTVSADVARAWNDYRLSCTAALRSSLLERLTFERENADWLRADPHLSKLLGADDDYQRARQADIPPTAITPERVLEFDQLWDAAWTLSLEADPQQARRARRNRGGRSATRVVPAPRGGGRGRV